MPVSVEVLGGAASVLFRGAPSSVWGTAVDNPVVAMLESRIKAIATGLLYQFGVSKEGGNPKQQRI